jgi:tellurite resistance protein
MMTTEQIDVFARGLYHVAKADGIQEEELALIGEFLAEVDSPTPLSSLAESSFHVAELAVLETVFLKRVFLKACLVLVRRDGVVSNAEKALVAQIAGFLGLADELETIAAEAAESSF